MRLIKKNMEGPGFLKRQSKQQHGGEGIISMKLCGKGSGWAWVTATWQARIKTSDLSSEAKGPLAWFTLVKPSCCKQHLALGCSMEVQRN